MDYESDSWECDIWAGYAVLTCKYTGRSGMLCLTKNGRNATKRMIGQDVEKYGAEKALSVYAKLVDTWQGGDE